MKTAWIFDVDGVITNPSEKKITQPEILDRIVKKLEYGGPVALNTGRSLVWIIDRVINPLLEKIKDKKVLKFFFASGEKGGTWITFDENGNIRCHKDKSISVPKSLKDKVRLLINSDFPKSMFFDETKETAISIEMKDGYPVERFTKQQQRLSKKLQEIINKEKLPVKLKIDPTTIATDIENVNVGKGFAIERILAWLKEIDVNPYKIVTFGDSFSDLSMPEALYEKGENVEFVYVGREDVNALKYPFAIKLTEKKFENGTLEFLRKI